MMKSIIVFIALIFGILKLHAQEQIKSQNFNPPEKVVNLHINIDQPEIHLFVSGIAITISSAILFSANKCITLNQKGLSWKIQSNIFTGVGVSFMMIGSTRKILKTKRSRF